MRGRVLLFFQVSIVSAKATNLEYIQPASSTEMIRLLFVGGPAKMQKGLLMGLDAELDFHVIAETESCEKAKQLIIELNPDVILVDLDTPGGGGIPLTEASRVLAPDIAVVLLSLHDDLATCAQARKAGAAALVSKTMPAQTLFATIRAAADLSAGSKNVKKSDVNQPSRNEMRGKR